MKRFIVLRTWQERDPDRKVPVTHKEVVAFGTFHQMSKFIDDHTHWVHTPNAMFEIVPVTANQWKEG